MLPLKDDNPIKGNSIGTFLIIIINIAAWFYIQNMGIGEKFIKSVVQYGLIPADLFQTVDPGTRINIGHNIIVIIDGKPNWLTLITSMFMHGSWFHLITNMWFLFIFGDNVEEVLGTFKYLIFYILCGLGAAITQATFSPYSTVPMVGASGAIGGVMGAYAILFPRAPVHMLVFIGFYFTRIIIPAFLVLSYWFLLQILGGIFSFSARGGVAFWAHVGGFISGIYLIRRMVPQKERHKRRKEKGITPVIIRRYK